MIPVAALEPPITAPEMPAHRDAFVELENVTHTYGREERQVHALIETNLRIEQGDFVALVGPSGCGKSTILKLVTGLITASSGYVYVAGREVGAEPVRVGMAFQNPTLLPWLTLLDNVMLPLRSFRHTVRIIAPSATANFATRSKRCWRRSDSPASATSFLGSSRAACCSAHRCAGR